MVVIPAGPVSHGVLFGKLLVRGISGSRRGYTPRLRRFEVRGDVRRLGSLHDGRRLWHQSAAVEWLDGGGGRSPNDRDSMGGRTRLRQFGCRRGQARRIGCCRGDRRLSRLRRCEPHTLIVIEYPGPGAGTGRRTAPNAFRAKGAQSYAGGRFWEWGRIRWKRAVDDPAHHGPARAGRTGIVDSMYCVAVPGTPRQSMSAQHDRRSCGTMLFTSPPSRAGSDALAVVQTCAWMDFCEGVERAGSAPVISISKTIPACWIWTRGKAWPSSLAPIPLAGI